MKKFIAVVLCVLMAAVSLTGCSSANKQSVDAIKKEGKIIMATNAEFPPYEYRSEGKVLGVDVDIAEAIAKELGVELEIQYIDFYTIITSVQNGKVAMGIAGMTVTDERKESVDFSVSYATSTQYIIVPESMNIETVADLAGKKIGVQLGTTGDFVVSDEISGYFDDDGNKTKDGSLEGTGATVQSYTNANLAAAALDAGKIDAVVIDKLTAELIVNNYSGMKVVKFLYTDKTDTQESYAICVAKGNDELLEVINKVLNNLIAEGKIDEFTINHTTNVKA